MEDEDIQDGLEAEEIDSEDEDKGKSSKPEDDDGAGQDAAADADGDDEGESDDEDEDDKPKRRRRGGRQKRIRFLSHRARALEQENAQLRARIEGGGQPAQRHDDAPDGGEQPPKQDDYDNYAEFLKDLSRYEGRQGQREESAAQQRREVEQAQARQARQTEQQLHDNALSAYEAGVEAYDDFEDVAYNPEAPATDTMVAAILDSDIAHELQYYLGSHPKVAARIAKLSTFSQAREIGKLEAQLSGPRIAKTTKTPQPVQPVAGGGRRARKRVNPDDLPIDQWMKKDKKGEIAKAYRR